MMLVATVLEENPLLVYEPGYKNEIAGPETSAVRMERIHDSCYCRSEEAAEIRGIRTSEPHFVAIVDVAIDNLGQLHQAASAWPRRGGQEGPRKGIGRWSPGGSRGCPRRRPGTAARRGLLRPCSFHFHYRLCAAGAVAGRIDGA